MILLSIMLFASEDTTKSPFHIECEVLRIFEHL